MVGSRIYNGKETRHSLFDDLVGIDLVEGAGVDRVLNLEHALPEDLGLFDHVECTSVLEHSKRPWRMAENIERLMKPGASIYVSVPFVWRIHAYPNDYWRMSRAALPILFPSIDWMSLMYADRTLHTKDRIPATPVDDYYHIARSETCGFGYRK
jgi:hypothetical protein